jgi:Tfp pilus assembly protein PilX
MKKKNLACWKGRVSKQKGLTLFELILALTMISVILFTTTTLNVAAARFTSNMSEEVRLHNQIHYVLRDIELNIRAGSNPTLSPSVCPGTSCLQVTGPDGDIKYVYNSSDRTVSRVTTVTTVISSGVIIPKPTKSIFVIPVPAGPLVEINIAAETVRNGKTITVPGITKSILLRGIP